MFQHGTGGLRGYSQQRNFWPASPTGTRTCGPHIKGSGRAVSEWQPASLRQLIIQTVHILQLDSAVTDSCVVRPFQPYFPITQPGSSTITPPYQQIIDVSWSLVVQLQKRRIHIFLLSTVNRLFSPLHHPFRTLGFVRGMKRSVHGIYNLQEAHTLMSSLMKLHSLLTTPPPPPEAKKE